MRQWFLWTHNPDKREKTADPATAADGTWHGTQFRLEEVEIEMIVEQETIPISFIRRMTEFPAMFFVTTQIRLTEE